MDTIIALCHHSSHLPIDSNFLQQFSSNYTLKYLTVTQDPEYKEGVTHIDYTGSMADANTYADIPNASVTAYINMFCAQSIPNIQQGLEQIHRTLKPGGYFAVSKLNREGANQPINNASIEFFKSKGYALSGPTNIRVNQPQTEQHIQLTNWFILQKPKTSGRRKTKRSKRKHKKTHKKRIY